ncbi:MAG TPA: alpha-amylase family glycosyl hydrolase [Gemmatimonadaceae bacterium]|nr:alpha-amylase family glycosyl hydrolase [Gemmatimonadaceae bacterium]
MPRFLSLVSWATLLAASTAAAQPVRAPADSAWRNGGVCYEIFVRSFFDSDSDGVGDLRGIIRKLDYINDGDPRSTRSLGAKCIWLMPIDPSPSYHGYDVTNYYAVNPEYGTEADFRHLVSEAHRRGIAVLVDLVLNHASSEHPYFKEALRDTTSAHRGWFRFSRTDPATRGPWGQQLWHKSPVRDEYYYGIFTSEMPDLNYDDPAVRAEADRIGRFWLTQMGVDGFRLDAVPYLVESGGAVSNTRGTHDVLRAFARTVRRTKPGAFTVGEVWDSIGTILPYYPDQLDAYFVFEISDALIEGVRTGSPARFLSSYARMQRAEPAARWAPFQRNHDQTRTMTALGNDRAGARLAAELLLTLPGVPFIYYGEEIGMTGDKPDPRLRTPMQWTPGPRAGFSTAPVWEPLQPDSATANVAVESADSGSLLHHYRRLVHLRASNRALGSGELVPLVASDSSVAAYLRRDGARSVLVVANLARSSRTGVSVSSAAAALPAGHYGARDLLSGTAAATLEVGTEGRIGTYTPIATLAPQRAYVFQLMAMGR